MDGNKKESAAAGKYNAGSFFALRLAVAAYLGYLGFDLLRDHLAGVSTLSAAASWGFGVGFMAAALAFGVYSVLRYRRENTAARAGGESPEADGTSDGEN